MVLLLLMTIPVSFGYFLFDKCQVRDKVKTFVRRTQKEFDLPIKNIRSDNGTKFKNT
jgi:hypothetical protein